jgi:hypothetical protein
MRAVVFGIATAVVVASFGGTPAAAQAPAAEKKAPSSFSGIKLVDLHARKAEQTVTVRLTDDGITIVDPSSKKEVANLPYSGTTVSHTVSSAPPVAAGDPAAASTQPMAPPMYMGKTPRHWLTLKSGSDTTVLRVSERVYAQLKDSLATRNVQVQDDK